MEYLKDILLATWQIFLDASPFIILGFLFAAFIRAFISTETIIKYMGKRNLSSVFWASLMGVPLPLCSCGVVPTAIGLRKQGASKPATVAFLISTPESSIDSIAITYALIDPLMTIFRPVAAFITGFVAGIAEILFGKKEETHDRKEVVCPHCHKKEEDAACSLQSVPHRHSFASRVRLGLRFAFLDLLPDVSRWFLLGMLIAGIITFAIPQSFIESHLGGGFSSMLIMLAIGLPLYVCATASTPIAAALILKGMSPGAALVFLLAGPATNAASISVLTSVFGKRSVVIYLFSISVCAILLGLLLDNTYALLGINITAVAGHAHEMVPLWLKWGTAVPLTTAMVVGAIKGKSE